MAVDPPAIASARRARRRGSRSSAAQVAAASAPSDEVVGAEERAVDGKGAGEDPRRVHG